MSERVVAVIPVGLLERAKSRLGAVLDAEERRDLVIGLFERTLRAAAGTPGISRTLVVSPDPEVASIAESGGADVVRQGTNGLNQGLEEARTVAIEAGATALLVLPADLPGISPAALGDVLAVLERRERPLVAIVPDLHGRGTNTLLLAPPDVIPFAFGGDSRAAHRHAAATAGAALVEIDGPLSLDLDTPDDLLRAQIDRTVVTDA